MNEDRRAHLLAMALSRITLLLALYVVALAVTLRLGDKLPSTTVVSLPLQLCFLVAMLDFLRRSRLPRSSFGLSLGDAPLRDVAQALRFTLPVVVVIVGLKAAVCPERALFEPRDVAWLPLYVVSAFLQELVVRGGVQGMLARLLPGPRPGVRAQLIATTLFAVTHLHLAPWFAAASLPVGVVWGLLYARQGRLLGVVTSHVLIGSVTFFLLGISG